MIFQIQQFGYMRTWAWNLENLVLPKINLTGFAKFLLNELQLGQSEGKKY